MSVRNTVKSIQDIMRQDSGVDGDAQRISQLCWMFFLKIIDDQDQQLELMQDGYRSPIPKASRWRSWAADAEGITGDELLTFVNAELFPKLKALSVAGERSDRRRVVRDVFEDAYNYMKSGQLMRQVVNKINEVDFNNLAERQHFGDIYEQNHIRNLAINQPLRDRQVVSADMEMWEHHIEDEIESDTSLPPTEREAVIMARRGQGLFRQRVAQRERMCRITKVDNPAPLRASHAKPWRDCINNDERLDGENGLLLTPSIDHLFDRGFITFEDSGRLVLSPIADVTSLERMGVPTREPVNLGGQRRAAALSRVPPQFRVLAVLKKLRLSKQSFPS